MINPIGDERTGEWISLHNRGNENTDVTDWTIVDGKGRKAILTGSINFGESLRLAGDAKGKILLSNAGGSLMLYDKDGGLVDYVTWSKEQLNRSEEGIAFLFENDN